MRKNIALFAFLLVTCTLSSQSWKSSNRISGSENVTEIKSIIDLNGDIISLGHFTGTIFVRGSEDLVSRGGRDYFISKFNPDGEIEWIRQIGSNNHEYVAGGISSNSNGDIYVTGGFRNDVFFSSDDSITSAGAFDIFLTKYNHSGDLLWYKNIGTGIGNQRPVSLLVENNNDLLITGFFNDSIKINNDTTVYADNISPDYFYSKFDANGNMYWIKQIKVNNSPISGAIRGILTDDNNYIFAGIFEDTAIIDKDTLVSLGDSDAHLFYTNPNGEIQWIRKIQGEGYILAFDIISDSENNIYLAGYYNSPTITFDSTETSEVIIDSNAGDYDTYVAKYSNLGTLRWVRTNGGKGRDKIYSMEYFENEIYVCGLFSDTCLWGGIELTSDGINDQDMFVGNLDLEGNYRSANSFGGRNNSYDEARSIFFSSDNLYTIIRSNSDLLVLGDSIYTSSGEYFYIALGVIGCLPISVDNVIVSDVATCYGDSTGSLQILATGGFGSPWQYSIDNGLTYQADITYFGDLPAGEYPVVVIDKENCAQPGNIEVVGQPDSLVIELITSSDITNDADGSIVVAASGGSSPYTYTLQPNGTIQGFGTYTFGLDDAGIYVVEVNDAQNCGPVAIDTIEIISTVGIESITDLQIKVYPNPSSGMMTLEMPFEAMEATLEILSLTGQVVVSRQVYSSGGVIRETIDVSDLSKGMYMLRIDGRTLKSGIVVN